MCPSLRTINPLNRFKKGSIMVHILYHASKEPFYGVWLKEELSKHGYSISDGTLYPWLNRLEYSEILKAEKRNVNGKVRKYYSITEKGLEQFNSIINYLEELNNEVTEK